MTSRPRYSFSKIALGLDNTKQDTIYSILRHEVKPPTVNFSDV